MTKETYDLVAEQLLDATDEDVFGAYTDADAGRTVFAGGPDWDVDVACDLRVGGVWSIRSAPPDGTAYRETNRFTLVDRPRRLAFESALTMPDGSTVRRDVDVTFRSGERGRTRMTIVQKGFPTVEARDEFSSGFPGIFERLERLAARWSRGKARS
jgi:uncharacterized protein YndB with AHSA1/START domain